MKRLLLLALFAAGCDDESLPAKVANAQLHGIVAAQIDCSPTFVGQLSSYPSRYHLSRLLDGSCMVNRGLFWSRSEPTSAYCPTTTDETQRISVNVATGSLVLEGGEIALGPPVQVIPFGVIDTQPIETTCTGFNLEAFGVEP